VARYLVTGGCGFIGSHLVERLVNDGHKVIVIDTNINGKVDANFWSGVELVEGDVRDPGLVKQCMAKVDGCFHLAAVASVQKSNEDWIGTHEVNMKGAVCIFEAASFKKVPVVYASSAAVYGSNIDLPLKESSITKPVTAYGADKLGVEHHARVASIVHKVPTIGFRLFNVYGPRQPPNSQYSGVISVFSERLKMGEDIFVFGDGEQTRDFVYIDDAINFLYEGMEKIYLSPISMNVCTGKATSINQLVKTLMFFSDSQTRIHYRQARKGDIYTSIGDPSLAKKHLSISAKYSLYEGLKRYFDYDTGVLKSFKAG